jgi:hypothetical protein
MTQMSNRSSRAARDGHNAVTSPNLRDYESSKFELAEILRAIKSTLPKERADLHTRITELFTRLAEDRFNLVVVSRFSRGKSTLTNECDPRRRSAADGHSAADVRDHERRLCKP